MTSLQKLVCISLMQGTGNQENDIVDHVRVPSWNTIVKIAVRSMKSFENVRNVIKELA